MNTPASISTVTRDQEHTRLVAAIAIAAGLLGLAVNLWRPTAPTVGAVTTALDDFDPAVLDAVGDYARPVLAAATIRLALTVIVPLLILVVPVLRRRVLRLAGARDHSPIRGALVAGTIAAAVDLAQLPFVYWRQYVHEGNWGFRQYGFAGWLRDWATATALGVILSMVLAAGLLWMVGRWPRSWPWRATVAATALVGLLAGLYPLLIQPLFLGTERLEDPARLAVVEPILERAGEGSLPVYVGDASRRTSRVNAVVSGLGPLRRVVLYDNLFELPPDQVASVLGHELAHSEHRDIPRGIVLSAAGLLPLLLALGWVWRHPRVVRLVGARGPADPRLVVVGAAVVAIGQLLSLPVANTVSRRAEAAADYRAMELSQGSETLVRTARTFVVRDLSRPERAAWTVALFGTHPSPAERIRAAVSYADEHGLDLKSLEEIRRDEASIRHPAIAERVR